MDMILTVTVKDASTNLHSTYTQHTQHMAAAWVLLL